MTNPCNHLQNCCFCAEEATIARETRDEGVDFGWYYSENPQDGWMGPFPTRDEALTYAMDPEKGCEEDEDELSFRQIGDVAHLEHQRDKAQSSLEEVEHQRDGLLEKIAKKEAKFIGFDRLCDEINAAIGRNDIDSRSPIADALLDLRNGDPLKPLSDLTSQLKEKEAELFSAEKEIERRGTLYSDKFEECSEARIVIQDVLSLIEHSEGVKVHDDFECEDVDWQTLIEKNHFRTLCTTEPNGEIAWDWDIDDEESAPQPTESEGAKE